MSSLRNFFSQGGGDDRRSSSRSGRPPSSRSDRPPSSRSGRPPSSRSDRPPSSRSGRPPSNRGHHRSESRSRRSSHHQQSSGQPSGGSSSRQLDGPSGGSSSRLDRSEVEREPEMDFILQDPYYQNYAVDHALSDPFNGLQVARQGRFIYAWSEYDRNDSAEVPWTRLNSLISIPDENPHETVVYRHDLPEPRYSDGALRRLWELSNIYCGETGQQVGAFSQFTVEELDAWLLRQRRRQWAVGRNWPVREEVVESQAQTPGTSETATDATSQNITYEQFRESLGFQRYQQYLASLQSQQSQQFQQSQQSQRYQQSQQSQEGQSDTARSEVASTYVGPPVASITDQVAYGFSSTYDPDAQLVNPQGQPVVTARGHSRRTTHGSSGRGRR